MDLNLFSLVSLQTNVRKKWEKDGEKEEPSCTFCTLELWVRVYSERFGRHLSILFALVSPNQSRELHFP